MESARTLATNLTTTSQTNTGEQQLPGKYREFFHPQHHSTVHHWYYHIATTAQRHVFKQFIKDILSFDENDADSHMRPTFQTDLVAASAIVNANGAKLMAPGVAEKCTSYISYQRRAKQQQFRETFGTIEPPRITSLPSTETKQWFRAPRIAESGDFYHLKKPSEECLMRSNPILNEKKIKKPSDVTNAECEVIGPMGATSYGTMFPWKVAPKTGSRVVQKAHDSSVKGPPWGVAEPVDGMYNTTNKTSFEGHEYRFDQGELVRELAGSSNDANNKNPAKYIKGGPGMFIGKRRFQNYNDNYCDYLLALDRQRRKGLVSVPSDREVEESIARRKIPAVASAFARNSPATFQLPSMSGKN